MGFFIRLYFASLADVLRLGSEACSAIARSNLR
jgi:hypothetical protein